VRFHESREPLVVVAVIDDPEKQRNCGVMEFGIMLKGWGYGLVFTGIDERELEFVSRDEKLES
jgi:hypothetical protein